MLDSISVNSLPLPAGHMLNNSLEMMPEEERKEL
jgi:hypothetical protein